MAAHVEGIRGCDGPRRDVWDQAMAASPEGQRNERRREGYGDRPHSAALVERQDRGGRPQRLSSRLAVPPSLSTDVAFCRTICSFSHTSLKHKAEDRSTAAAHRSRRPGSSHASPIRRSAAGGFTKRHRHEDRGFDVLAVGQGLGRRCLEVRRLLRRSMPFLDRTTAPVLTMIGRGSMAFSLAMIC